MVFENQKVLIDVDLSADYNFYPASMDDQVVDQVLEWSFYENIQDDGFEVGGDEFIHIDDVKKLRDAFFQFLYRETEHFRIEPRCDFYGRSIPFLSFEALRKNDKAWLVVDLQDEFGLTRFEDYVGREKLEEVCRFFQNAIMDYQTQKT